MTIRLGDSHTVSAQVRMRVDTETGEVSLHTDPADLTPRPDDGTPPITHTESDALKGRTIAFLVAPEGVEEVELTEPWAAVRRAGGIPRLVSTVSGSIQAFRHLDRSATYPVDHTLAEVTSRDFDGLVLPGGVANPDYLRTRGDAVGFARDFFGDGRPVASICHAPWTLIDADVVGGRRITSWPSLHADLVNAGAEWVDEEVVVCRSGPNVLISSRRPDDLPAFCAAAVDEFARAGSP